MFTRGLFRTRDTQALRWKLAGVIVEASLAVQASINALSVSNRGLRAPSPLKPPPETSALVDAVGEEAAFQKLEILAQQWGIQLRVLVDVSKGSYVSLGPSSDGNPSRQFVASPPPQSQPHTQPYVQQHIWVALDAVDGTLKLCGLGNEPGRARMVNDGTWAIGLAMTEPTHKAMPEVCFGDFCVALILDGRPQSSSVHPGSTEHPAGALAISEGAQGGYVTYEICPHGALTCDGLASLQQQGLPCTNQSYSWLGPRLHTTSSAQLNQCFVYLDTFQAFDRRTHEPGDDKLAPALYGRLMDRHNGGAFDVLRSYGNLSGLLSTMLGWRGANVMQTATTSASGCSPEDSVQSWLEPQCGAFVVLNENLPNLIPSVPIILGAGGNAFHLKTGTDLRGWSLQDGRCSIAYTANAILKLSLQKAVELAAQDKAQT
ncbi:hypothetical protein DUNSADRAFT_14882 [Dunaliella salina]|uniref:Uncharacterized protein n=1 Tax=Dunaliella salina TaxID=3046 RepID=A0ABQ7G6I4_DUNSA|nr:hypothetical protein DUNSADRAFT_14882 [Dunaliella salina]|eukprot:KAF5830220.1 hypothetical protein DUNSADRAFT_14882 [Dunaliella salina]